MQESFETLEVFSEEAVGRLMLNRPEKLNALSPAMLEELIRAARWFDSQPAVRVVVVAGAGRAFCAGFDLNFFGNSNAPPGHADADLGRVMAEQLAGMRALTIVAIQGRCVGGGVVIAASCDLRIAADDAVFSIPEADMGIPLAWGGIPRLVREIGPAMTRELVLDCREFSAAEAQSLRLVNRLVPANRLAVEAAAWAQRLSRKAGRLLDATKRQVNAAADRLLSPAAAVGDADELLAALGDPECRETSRKYLAQRLKR